MPTKPKYITEMEAKIAKLQQSHEELKRNHDGDAEVHAEILGSLTEIKICLKGTEFDEEEGGLVKQVHQNTKCIQHMKREQAKRQGMLIVATGVFSAILTSLGAWFIKKNGG